MNETEIFDHLLQAHQLLGRMHERQAVSLQEIGDLENKLAWQPKAAASRASVDNLIRFGIKGAKSNAIEEYRAVTSCSLKEAKDAVESLFPACSIDPVPAVVAPNHEPVVGAPYRELPVKPCVSSAVPMPHRQQKAERGASLDEAVKEFHRVKDAGEDEDDSPPNLSRGTWMEQDLSLPVDSPVRQGKTKDNGFCNANGADNGSPGA